jgi:hypothetical protein
LNFLLRCTPSFSAIFEAAQQRIRGATRARYAGTPHGACSGGRVEGKRNGGPRVGGASFVIQAWLPVLPVHLPAGLLVLGRQDIKSSLRTCVV